MPFLSPSALRHRLAEHDAGILGRVVLVDMQIALGLERNVDQRVAGELLDHVVEEADPGRDLVGPGPVEIDGGRDRGLLGLARDGRPPGFGAVAPLLHVSQPSARPLPIRFRALPLIREQRSVECYQSHKLPKLDE